MKAILRDTKGWTKTMQIPYPMREIRLPLHRKHKAVFEAHDGAWVSNERTVDMVIFELTGQGLSHDVAYYDEVQGGASESAGIQHDSNASSPYDESHGGANPSPAHQNDD